MLVERLLLAGLPALLQALSQTLPVPFGNTLGLCLKLERLALGLRNRQKLLGLLPGAAASTSPARSTSARVNGVTANGALGDLIRGIALRNVK